MSTWETPRALVLRVWPDLPTIASYAIQVHIEARDRQTAARLRADLLPHLAHAPLTRAVVDAILADLERA